MVGYYNELLQLNIVASQSIAPKNIATTVECEVDEMLMEARIHHNNYPADWWFAIVNHCMELAKIWVDTQKGGNFTTIATFWYILNVEEHRILMDDRVATLQEADKRIPPPIIKPKSSLDQKGKEKASTSSRSRQHRASEDDDW